MKKIKEKFVGSKRHVTVELDADETLLSVTSGYYRLGYPLNDIVFENIISEARQVQWDSLSQEWMEC